jgi:hypothetical protein
MQYVFSHYNAVEDWAQWHMPGIAALGGYSRRIENLRPAWTIVRPGLKKPTNQPTTQQNCRSLLDAIKKMLTIYCDMKKIIVLLLVLSLCMYVCVCVHMYMHVSHICLCISLINIDIVTIKCHKA